MKITSYNYSFTKTSRREEWRWQYKLHRKDGPADIYYTGTHVWYCEGARHREDGPAYTCINGDILWYRNGQPYYPHK